MPRSVEAFELLCEGRRLWSERRPDRVAQAVVCLENAIVEESKISDRLYTAAYAALADCYTFLYLAGGRHSDVYYKALGTAEVAVKNAPSDADSHAALGAVRAIFERNWADAEAEFCKALELLGDHFKTGHRGSLQNRPTDHHPGRLVLPYRLAVWQVQFGPVRSVIVKDLVDGGCSTNPAIL